MNTRSIVVAAIATAGLAFAPLASDARILLLSTCTGGVHMIVLPGDPTAPPDQRDHCGKACHAATKKFIGFLVSLSAVGVFI